MKGLLQYFVASAFFGGLCGACPEAAAQLSGCQQVIEIVDIDWVSIPELEQCAAEGDTESEAMLGMMMWGASDGMRAERYGLDPTLPLEHLQAEGLRLLRSAADKGNNTAMNEIGLAYLDSTYGLEQDPEAAREWLTRSSDAGDFIAAFNLARMHVGGIGVPRSMEQGEALLKFSAKRDYWPAICSLRVLREQGLVFESMIHRGYYAMMRVLQPDAQCWTSEIMPELIPSDDSSAGVEGA